MIEGLATAPPPFTRPQVNAATSVRERWRMGSEARALTLISAVLTAFGLAVLYSASAFVAMSERVRGSSVQKGTGSDPGACQSDAVYYTVRATF